MKIRIYRNDDYDWTIATFDDVKYWYDGTIYFADGTEERYNVFAYGVEMLEPETYTVALMTDHGWCETCHPLAIGVDNATAKSIKRHFDKLCEFDNYTQTGQYVMVVSRVWCTNHEDFEHETSIYNEDDEVEHFKKEVLAWQ